MTSVATINDRAGSAARARIAALALDELNPADPQYFVDDTVGYVFERLRREDPVHRSHSAVPGIDTYWSVTRYQDIMQVDTHHSLYSSEGGITLMDFPPDDEQKLKMFIAMDPPRHDEQRKAVSPIVAPANLIHWHDLIRERTGTGTRQPAAQRDLRLGRSGLDRADHPHARDLIRLPDRGSAPAAVLVGHGDRQ